MAMPEFTIRDLLEAGVHFGHKTHRWNPQMREYIYGSRNGIHVIDLRQTVPMLYRAMSVARQTVAGGGRILFVGSKRQAQEIVAESAGRCGQYYVNHRWLGGMLTNWKTINNSIRRLKQLEEIFANPEGSKLTKMEKLRMQREFEKLERSLGGIKNMGGLPDAIFVIDTVKEHIAVAEANNLGIPVIGILDSNSSPEGIDYPIPGNDDSSRALRLYCSLISGAVLDGISQQLAQAGKIAPMQKEGGSKANDRKTVVNLSPKATEAASSETSTEEEEKPATAATPTEEKAVKAAAANQN